MYVDEMQQTITITNKTRRLVCQRCGHPWNYTGSNEYIASCPHCQTKVSVRKHLNKTEEKLTCKKPLQTASKVGPKEQSAKIKTKPPVVEESGEQEDKPKVDAYVIEDRNKDKKGFVIHSPEEKAKYRSADPTTNQVF